MEITFKREPKIRISYDEMEAYLLLPSPLTPDEEYEFSDIMEKIITLHLATSISQATDTASITFTY